MSGDALGQKVTLPCFLWDKIQNITGSIQKLWCGPTLVFMCSLQLDNVFFSWFVLLQTRLLTLPSLWPAWSSTSLCRWSQSLSRVSPQTKMSKMPAWLKRSAGNLTHSVIQVEGHFHCVVLHSIIKECFKENAYWCLLPEVFPHLCFTFRNEQRQRCSVSSTVTHKYKHSIVTSICIKLWCTLYSIYIRLLLWIDVLYMCHLKYMTI